MITAALILAASLSVTPRVTTYAVPQKRLPTEIVRHGDELWFVAWEILPADDTGRPKLQPYFGRTNARGRMKLERAAADHMPGFATHTPDGTMWFSDAKQGAFWRIAKGGRIERVPGSLTTLHIAYAGGDLWCSHPLSGRISRYGTDGSSKGAFEVDAPPMTSTLPPPDGPRVMSLVAGPDGALWFTERHRNRIGRLTTSGELKFFAFEPRLGDFSEIIAGPDGALWFTTRGKLLGRITTAGEITTVRIGFVPRDLTSDSRGRIWYTDGGQAGIVDPDRTVHEFLVPGAQKIRSMTEGPDGAMWFADENAKAIGKIELNDARAAGNAAARAAR